MWHKNNLLDMNKFNLLSKLNILRKIIGLENDKLINTFNYVKWNIF